MTVSLRAGPSGPLADADTTSDLVENDSTVPGSSVTDALDFLLANSGGGTNSILETFAGGTATTISASNTAANIGDMGWNYITSNGSGAGSSAIKIAGEAGAVGIYRLTSPTLLFARSTIYLGSPTLGIFATDGWASCTFRARFNPAQAANNFGSVGVVSAAGGIMGASESAGFIASGAEVNYTTRTSHLSAGNFTQDTGVPIDDQFHDFKIVRVSASQLDFYIDDVLRTSHIDPPDGMPAGPMIPVFIANGSGATTFVDCDAFTFEPA